MASPPTHSPEIGANFDEVILPHLGAAHRLARWLTGNDDDAEDVVQEASLRALRYFRTFSRTNGRAWFLTIVRNACWSWRARKSKAPTDLFDEEQHSADRPAAPDPETLLLHAADAALVGEALSALPPRARELLVLRELEGLSYQEVADLLGIPLGTVMSGLSRARRALRRAVGERLAAPATAVSGDGLAASRRSADRDGTVTLDRSRP